MIGFFKWRVVFLLLFIWFYLLLTFNAIVKISCFMYLYDDQYKYAETCFKLFKTECIFYMIHNFT